MALRKLTRAERRLAKSVYGNSLPAWWRIRITDAIGPLPTYTNPYTIQLHHLFALNLGPSIYPNATLSTVLPSYGKYRDVFIHELMHVWQYYQGIHQYSVYLAAAIGNYSYTPGKSWGQYNTEQQADLVEHWFARGMSTTDPRYVYIDKIVRRGLPKGPAALSLLANYGKSIDLLSVAELKSLH